MTNRVVQRLALELEGYELNPGYQPKDLRDVDIIFRDKARYYNVPAESISWVLGGVNYDIVWYRPSKVTELGEKTTMTTEFHGNFGELTDKQQNEIINPKHYKILSPQDLALFLNKGMEYMDIMRYALARHKGVIAHVLGQVFKYSFRLGGKDDILQDAKKIAWYSNRLVEEIEYERKLSDTKPRGEYKE